VDEVGQFIGDNTQMMLTLQTIIEQLGGLCQGRAWVIVTSQEDIDAAIGETNKAKSQDFSKIQGRFHTRLSLASSNTDDVISERLLSKTEAAHVELRDCFAQKGDIINNQLAFVGNSVSMRSYKDAAEFVACYPFAPYQFTLLQKVFESIRKVGATGKHLSKGERSLLDAFQSAAVRNADRNIDALVPMYDFYPSIESFIDTSAKRSIDEAPSNPSLETYDVLLLKALFLIRYIPDIVKPNVDNLATLCVDQIDADKLALKRKIQESLTRLEQQRLVSRNGDLWFFLTNEERDVAREIGHVDVSSVEKSRLLGELIFEEILGGMTKIRHRDTRGDYEINRLLDGAPWKNASHQLSFEIVTPLSDDYESLSDAKAILRSADRALIRMAESNRLDIELNLYQQIEKYIDSPKASSAAAPLKRILADRKDENRERKARLIEQLSTALVNGDCYALGQKLPSKAAAPSTQVDELVNYLISNTYTKLKYLKIRQLDPIAEIKAVLMADSIGQHALSLGGEEGNPLALNEMREYLQLKASQSRVMLSDVVDRFSGAPWGWKPEWEIVLLIARLFMAGEIKLVSDNSDLEPGSAVDALTKSVRFKQVSILKRKTADAVQLKRARELHKDLFSKLGRDDEDGLVADFRESLTQWQSKLKEYSHLSTTRHHPGKAVIEQNVLSISKQLAIRDSFEFVEAILANKDEWLDAADDIHDLISFYTTQIATWRRMLDALQRFEPNRPALLKEVAAATALQQLEAIRDNPMPYQQINQIETLIQSVDAVNVKLVDAKREHALLLLEKKIAEVGGALDQAHAQPELRNRALSALQKIKLDIAAQSSIPQIHYLQDQSGSALDGAMDMIAAALSAVPKAQPLAVKSPGDHATVINVGSVPITQTVTPKPARVIRAADFSSKSYLETEAEVDDYLSKLKAELLAAIRAGQRARIQ
jgi:hypothetical protein